MVLQYVVVKERMLSQNREEVMVKVKCAHRVYVNSVKGDVKIRRKRWHVNEGMSNIDECSQIVERIVRIKERIKHGGSVRPV